MLDLVVLLEAVSRVNNLVVERHVLAEGSRIPLSRTTSNQLPVNPSGIMKFRANDLQTSPLGDLRLQFNVGTTSRHVCCNRYFPKLARE